MTLNLDHGDTLATALDTGLSSASARPLSFMDDIGDGLSGNKDVDLYQFTASAGDRLTATTAQLRGGRKMDTYLRLFDASGTQLAADNNSGGPSSDRIDYTFASAGTYYIGVSSSLNTAYDPAVAGSGTAGDTGDYGLSLNLDHGDTLTTALSTGLTTAQPLTFTEDVGDGPWVNKDVDLYKFTASADDRLTAITAAPRVAPPRRIRTCGCSTPPASS